MRPATATEALVETPREWRKRKAAEIRQRYREGWSPGGRAPFRVAILQAEEALVTGYWWGLEEQREVLGEVQICLAVLRDHFARGSLRDASGLGGTLSNITAEAEVKLRALLDRTEAQR